MATPIFSPRGNSRIIANGRREGVMAGFSLDPTNGPYFLTVQETSMIRTEQAGASTDGRGVAIVEFGSPSFRFLVELDIIEGLSFPLNGTDFSLTIANEGSVPASYAWGILRGSPAQTVFTRTRLLQDYAAGVTPDDSAQITLPPFRKTWSINIPSSVLPPGMRMTFRSRTGVVINQWDIAVPTSNGVDAHDLSPDTVEARIVSPAPLVIARGSVIFRLGL